jgi:hypothetical protein
MILSCMVWVGSSGNGFTSRMDEVHFAWAAVTVAMDLARPAADPVAVLEPALGQ